MDMKRRALLRTIGAAGATLTVSGMATAVDGSAQYIVKSNGKAVDRLQNSEFTVRHELAEGGIAVVTGPKDAGEELAGTKQISSVTRDVAIELDLPDIDAEESSTPGDDAALRDLQWDKDLLEVGAAHEGSTGEGSRIAIVDTGIDLAHPDLGNVNEDLGAAFVLNDDVPEYGPDDPGGHGTHVAGIAGATGEVGVVGVAPDAELVPIRVFPREGSATFGDILAGIDYAAEIGADAANFSLGIPGVQEPGADVNKLRANVQTVFQSATRRGTVITGSAGNDAGNLQQGGGFTLPNSVSAVMTVSATSPADTLSFYSNYGTSDIDVAAPGGWYETVARTLGETGEPGDIPFPLNGVYSTFPTDQGGYTYQSGTSMAAPQVAGLVGLVRAADDSLNANQVESAIEAGADGTSGKSDPEFGAGRINARDTLEQLD